MSTPWIQHVKHYQAMHGGSYKDAMTHSRATYQQMSGGKFNVKKAFGKAKRGVKSANQFYDQNQALINGLAGEENAKMLAQARAYSGQADALTGGKFNMHNAMRKTVNTARQVKNVARIAAPILSVVAPEIGIPMQAAVMATGGSFRVNGGGLYGGKGSNTCCAKCGAISTVLKTRSISDRNAQ